MPDRADDDDEEQPERREHRYPCAHDQERVDRSRCLCLLRGQAAAPPVDKPSFVDAEVERRPVEGERAAEERRPAPIRHASRRRRAADRRQQREEAARDEHRQSRHEVDMRMTNRVDPLACVPRPVQPVSVGRLHLDHALHRPDGQRDCARREELPEVPLRLRDLDEP